MYVLTDRYSTAHADHGIVHDPDMAKHDDLALGGARDAVHLAEHYAMGHKSTAT